MLSTCIPSCCYLVGALLLALTTTAIAQFPPPPKREHVKVVKSKFHPGIEISYKEVDVCGFFFSFFPCCIFDGVFFLFSSRLHL
jgi:hypothetical protein